MKVPNYRMLVVDDQIGRPGAERASFLERSASPFEDFVFCSGQDEEGRNRHEGVMREVCALWEGIGDSRLSLVLLDVRFDDRNDHEGGARFGFTLLRALRARFGRALPIVMLTSVNAARGDANAAEADGFLPKEELTPETLKDQLFRNGVYPEDEAGILGFAPTFLLTLREVRRVVASGIRELLLLGESGTGKSELARYIHRVSNRTGRFETWFGRRANSELHYDQLFGHWKGAFDGAKESRAGAAERAHQGTLFVDEIAELGPETQTDFLEYRQRGQDGLRRVRRMGNSPEAARTRVTRGLDLIGTYSSGEDRILVDTTLVSATNRPIDDDSWRKNAGYRQDLFNRLGHRLRLPPLRERVGDIAPLFTEMLNHGGLRPITVTRDAQAALESYDWHEGNIAELKRVAETVVTRLGPDFCEVHPHHIEGLLTGSSPSNRIGDSSVIQPAADWLGPDPIRPPQASSFVDVELQSLRNLAEFLRAAVVETRRPTGLGSLADILKRATGVEYAPTDVKREVKSILEAWFVPNARQSARWRSHPEYARQADAIRHDKILSTIYRYSTGELAWDTAKAAIMEGLDE